MSVHFFFLHRNNIINKVDSNNFNKILIYIESN